MGLSSQFPYYGPLGSGNYNVSLAIPGPLSKISKFYGIKASSTGVGLPNTDFLKEFAIGNLGISDGFMKEMIFKNINSPIASTNEAVFKQFAKQQRLDVSDMSKFKKGNKYVMPMDSISLSPEFEMTGFKAFEKTVFQSIFETQKPFMEIAKIAIESVAKAEDVIARVAVLLAANPLKAKSRKPIGNAGAGNRPKAIGYKAASELKSKLREFESIRTRNDSGVIKSDTGDTNNTFVENNDISNNTSLFEQKWKVLSTVYSTVTFDSNVNYVYSYINLPADIPYPEVDPIDLTNEDPYDKYKPKSIIFGIYNSKGEAIDPNSTIKTIGLSGNNRIEVDTPFKRADWALRSPKWIFPEGTIEWPSFGTPNYLWKKTIPFFIGAATIIAKKQPLNLGGYVQMRYKEGEKNILTGLPAIKDDPIIVSFDNIEYDTYNKYYGDLIGLAMERTGLPSPDKIRIERDIKSRLEIKNQVEATFNYGHLKSSVYKRVGRKDVFPSFMKKSFLPYQIYRPESELDSDIIKLNSKKGEKPGFIWIDPEADYDLKVIRVDPASSIEYIDPISKGELKTKIETFVKNKVTFTGASFSISIQKNGQDEQVFNNISQYTIENWNYESSVIKNLNNFKISIWSEREPAKFSNKNFYNWSVPNPLAFATASQTFTNNTITKLGNGKWYSNTISKDGINKLADNTIVMTKNNIITRWYYIYNESFTGGDKLTNDSSTFKMPGFGIDRTINLNYETGKFDIKDTSIPLYKIKIDGFTNNIIDPSQITNNFLTTPELFAKDPEFYGHGDDDDPQTLGRINRYALTDLDTESYYIVEGILKSENEFETDDNGKRLNSGRGSGGGGWYRLPHALGAASSFIKLIIDIAVKMIPKITKLLTLFQNPFKFITDIMADKLNKNFDFLSDEAIKTFKIANQIKSQTDKIGDISSIKNRIDTIRINAKEQASNILNSANGKTDIEQRQAERMAKDIQDRAENQALELDKISNKKKNLVNKLRDFYKNSILSNYIFVDEKSLDNIFVLSGGATIPFNLFGADLSFGIAAEMNNVPKKPVVKLIFPGSVNKFKNVQYLIDRDSNKVTSIEDTNIEDEKNKILNDRIKIDSSTKRPPFVNKQFTNIFKDSDTVDISFEDGSVTKISSDSLQTFVTTNKNKYNFVYVTQELNSILVEVDSLIKSDNQSNLDIAKEKLDLAKSNFPNNSAIDDKLNELNEKNKQLSKNTQPLLKTLLGFITFPVKVIADILKWLFDFFISLTNPFTLASKMKEFLSFKWILKFVSPTYILDIFGFKFKPEKLASFAGKSGDLSQYISLGFIPKLPNYGKEQFKDLKDQPLRLLSIFKMMGKIINAVIDFIWSIFGIEAIIPVPHMKIVPDKTPYSGLTAIELNNLVNGIKPSGKDIDDIIKDNVISDDSNDTSSYGAVENFIYEVRLSDGSIKSFLNREELDKFILDNNSIDFDFTFD